MQARRRSRRRVVELGKRLFLDRDDRHVVAESSCGLEDAKREAAVAGYETEMHNWTMVMAVAMTVAIIHPPVLLQSVCSAAAESRPGATCG